MRCKWASCGQYSGVVLLIGGYPRDDGLVLAFDPESGVVGPWVVGQMEQSLSLGWRFYHVAAAIGDGIVVAGGRISGEWPTPSTEVFSGPTGPFAHGPNMQHGRQHAAGAIIGQLPPLPSLPPCLSLNHAKLVIPNMYEKLRFWTCVGKSAHFRRS